MYVGPGIYEHHKGSRYYVLGLARHSERDEDLVVYAPIGSTDLTRFWVRPLWMFNQEVPIPGTIELRPRFRLLEADLAIRSQNLLAGR